MPRRDGLAKERIQKQQMAVPGSVSMMSLCLGAIAMSDVCLAEKCQGWRDGDTFVGRSAMQVPASDQVKVH